MLHLSFLALDVRGTNVGKILTGYVAWAYEHCSMRPHVAAIPEWLAVLPVLLDNALAPEYLTSGETPSSE